MGDAAAPRPDHAHMHGVFVGTFGARSADELARVLATPEARLAGLVELRLDLVPDAERHVARLVAAAPAPVVATCRRAHEGGGFAGDERARLALLAAAAAAGAAWIDVEDDVADLPPLGGARLLRSVHLARLPEDLDARVARLLAPPAAAGKFVAWEGGPADALALLHCVARHAGRLAAHVVAQPATRTLSLLAGAPFAYAALRRGGRLGVALPTLRELAWRGVLGRARRGARAFVLLGASVEGSVSPALLNAAFAAADADVVALPWSCDDPEPVLDALAAFRWAGAAVTIPHKLPIAELLRARGARFGAEASATGAVNTVLATPDGLRAENTDVGGILDALAPQVRALGGATGLVLGAGGAARAGVLAVRRLGGRAVVHARRSAAAEELRAVGADAVAATPADALASAPRVVLDATPAGAPGGEPLLDAAALPAACVVLDMLVAPRPTALLAAAAAAGRATVAGVEMLAHQAARQAAHLGVAADGHELALLGAALLRARARSIVLVGLRATGKSTVATRVAALLGRAAVDTDELVAARAGASPDELLRSGREGAFRELERGVLAELAGADELVIATGGGAALAGGAFHALAAGALTVLLDARDDVLLARLAAVPRAALSALAPADELARQRAERMDLLRAAARVVLDTSDAAPDETADDVVAAYEREMPGPPSPGP